MPQSQVFDVLVECTTRAVLHGQNCSVFAYGQTGSGKTHTMNGSSQEDPGIVPRMMQFLLNQNVELSVSFLEIYNEKVCATLY